MKQMKRINKTWWKGHDGYYKEVAKHTWEGPFDSMQEPSVEEKVVTLDEPVSLKPANNQD